MQETTLRGILEQVAQQNMSVEQALARSRLAPIEDVLCGLTLDTHRSVRTGIGEVVFAQGKSDTQLLSAMEGLSAHAPVLATRVSLEQERLLYAHFAQKNDSTVSSLREGHLFSVGTQLPTPPFAAEGDVLVVSAGAADAAVALEAFGALHFWGISAGYIADVGVAGLHRLQRHLPALQGARLIIAVAGMEGALPGVLAGFVRCPVVAVPTSVGYGVGKDGHAALSTMLCTCVPGVAVCNIDNGFGAAAFAAKVIHDI